MHEKETILQFANELVDMGFTVYIAESGTYGFYTNSDQSRVISFGLSYGSVKLSHNCEPHEETGTGWTLALPQQWDYDGFNAVLNSGLPYWNRVTMPVKMATMATYLKRYQKSSKFWEFIGND